MSIAGQQYHLHAKVFNMKNLTIQHHIRWEFLAYGLCWGPMWFVYLHANKIYGTGGASGVDLSNLWWVFALLFLLADIILLSVFFYMWRKRASKGAPLKMVFLRDLSEIVPILIISHLFIMFSTYPVEGILESVGLGMLGDIIFVLAIMAIASARFRSLGVFGNSGSNCVPDSQDGVSMPVHRDP